MEAEKIHEFEAAGLGKAPFKFLFIYKIPSSSLAEANPDAYNAALREMPKGCGCGTCQFCGRAIMFNCIIESSDGKRFAVGTECVNKTGDRGLIKKVTMAARKLAREKREANAEAKRLIWLAEREKEREVERLANGGLTNEEMEKLIRQNRKEKRIYLLAPLADKLDNGKGGFRGGVAYEMRNDGRLPYGRGIEIMVDIIAKEAAGGKKKGDEYERACEWIDGVIKAVRELG